MIMLYLGYRLMFNPKSKYYENNYSCIYFEDYGYRTKDGNKYHCRGRCLCHCWLVVKANSSNYNGLEPHALPF